MEKQVHKIAKRSIINGVWTKDSYDVTIGGKTYDFRDLAKSYGIELPTAPNTPNKPKKTKKVNIDIEENSYGDMEQTHSSESVEEHGDGDSESTEWSKMC